MDKSKKITFAGLLLFPLFSLFILNTFILNDFSFKKERQPEVYLGEPGLEQGGSTLSPDTDAVTLLLEPSQLEQDLNSDFEIDLNLNTKEKTIGGSKIVLKYDPEYLNLKNSENGYIFTDPKFIRENDRVIFETNESLMGKGKITTLTFTPLKQGETSLEILSDSYVLNEKKDNKIETFSNKSLILIN